MAGAPYWEDVEEGTEIPPLRKNVSTRQLVQYAGASLDFYEIHYDKDYALGNDLPGQIIHGALKNAFLAQLMTDWLQDQGTLKKLSCQYRGMDVPGDDLVCGGTVTRKYMENGLPLVDCDIWLQNSKGERTTPGSATVVLPQRSQGES